MSLRIGLVHATLAPVEPMVAAFRTQAPHVTVMHFMDEGLLPLAESEGLTAAALAAIGHLVRRAEDSGAEAVLLTCSAYSPAVPELQRGARVPIVSADEAMLRGALGYGTRIGIVATVAAAGPTTAALLQNLAAESGRKIFTEVAVVIEAFAALKAGNGERHDALVREQIAALVPRVDAVVLAQISMARATVGVPAWSKPVLTSPEASVRAVLARLNQVA